MPLLETDAPALPILVAGDPRLKQRSTDIGGVDAGLLDEASRLIATLRDFRERSGFGRAISAVQVGIAKRLVAMNLGAGPFVLINPEIVARSPETFLVWDDCLSVPDVLVRVRRHTSISLVYRDHRFRERRWNRLPPDLSELVQHEIDHLDGVLMTERAEGTDGIQPIGRWQELVGASRPTHRISLAHIAEATALVDRVFTGSPQFECEALSEALGARLTLKVETLNPIRSFKGRGASYFVRKSVQEGVAPRRGFVCASAGNFGQGLAHAARQQGLPVTVFAASTANARKVDRMRALGAEVKLAGADFDAAKEAGRAWARGEGLPFVEDGREPWITEGAGTIGVEMLERDDAFDAILVPLGNGALLNGVARWIKAASPATEVIGVCAAGAPSMERSWRKGPGAPVVETERTDTIADGVAVRIPIAEAVADMHGLVDDVMLVPDDATREAMRLVETHAGVVLEPAGALGVAAVLAAPGRFAGRSLATILCGGNRAG
ncbi:MAG TPA: pyridoxal-phosphate dependent enzyme [Vicinamibacteria bacterium]|nr:pyridoxal-phosphate dependent enzyme [Vicinamibacteria bacterium]